jgi:hypothetical protein
VKKVLQRTYGSSSQCRPEWPQTKVRSNTTPSLDCVCFCLLSGQLAHIVLFAAAAAVGPIAAALLYSKD